jgi:uncharacterized membrane protein
MISLPGMMTWSLMTGGWVLLAQAAKAKAGSGDVMTYLIPLAIWGGILLLLIVLAAIVVRKLRDSATQNRQAASDLLSNFQEMRAEGDISDAEFRNIKSVLGNQLGSHVKSGKKTL